METYIEQLIADLKVAQHTVISPLKKRDSDNLPKTTMERLSGLEKICFPPAEKLSHQQLQALFNAMVTFLKSKKYAVNLPNDLPTERAYQKLLDKWTEEIEYVESGIYGLNFCPENLADCDIREFCGCCFEDDPANIPVYNGIFDDYGNKIDRLSLPMPDLCLSCASFLDDDWDENLLCDMTRFNRKEEEEFKCYAWRESISN